MKAIANEIEASKDLMQLESGLKTSTRRAALLADRIEEGAAALAAFAEGLSEAECI